MRTAFLRAHGLLVLVLCLVAFHVAILVAFGDHGLARYANLVGALGLLSQHLAIQYAKAGWQRTAMWTLFIACLGFIFAYLGWQFWLIAR